MKTSHRAFTLIELLVVIAIIAILAAILFPVFAQAKAAAKKTASLSNTKQMGLGIIMYAGDQDDTICPATAWNPQDSPGDFPFNFGDGWAAPWTWLVLPYIKSGDIFQDPQTSPTPDYAKNRLLSNVIYPAYGFNYVWLSPWDGTKQTPVSMTSLARPSGTVMLAGKWSQPESNLQDSFLGFAFDYASDGPLLNYTVEAPECYVIPQACGNNWGVDSWDTAQTVEAGRDTGANSLRSGKQMVLAWIDGHSSATPPGRMAAGTNWTPTINPGDVHYVDGWQDSNMWGAHE